MDVQKIKELALANGFSLKEQASGNMDLHSYVYEFANAIEQAAKAQAVPEGFVLMPKEPTQNIYRTFYDAFNSADAGNTAQNFKVAYKAMIEAQEQNHV